MWAATSFELDTDVVVRLLGATVLGGLVGIEREASDQPAWPAHPHRGGPGAALFGVVSTLGFVEFDQLRANSTLQADVTVASNVVVGIGFLGAGVIFRQGNTIRNLTTGYSMWVVAAIGLACGVGDVMTAAIATVVLLGSLVLLRPIRSVICRRWSTMSIVVQVHMRAGIPSDEVIDMFAGDGHVETDELSLRKDQGRMVLVSSVSGPPQDVRRWVSHLAARPEIESISEE